MGGRARNGCARKARRQDCVSLLLGANFESRVSSFKLERQPADLIMAKLKQIDEKALTEI